MIDQEYSVMNSEDYLEHYGVKGQKWGVTRTKEQLGYKDTPKKKKFSLKGFQKSQNAKRRAKLKAKASAAAKKAEQAAKDVELKKKLQEAKEKEAAAKKAESDLKKRERMLRATTDDAEYVWKNRHLLDTKEVAQISARFEAENKIKKVVDAKPSEFDKVMKSIKKINGTMNDVYSMWDSPAMKSIRKSLSGDSSSSDGGKSDREGSIQQSKGTNQNKNQGNNAAKSTGTINPTRKERKLAKKLQAARLAEEIAKEETTPVNGLPRVSASDVTVRYRTDVPISSIYFDKKGQMQFKQEKRKKAWSPNTQDANN